MNWVHTWFGVVLGSLLFAIFWTGTLSVFDKEIDRWMMPDTRLETPAAFSYETMRAAYAAAKSSKSPVALLLVPDRRSPVIAGYWKGGSGPLTQHLFDPRTGSEIPDQGTLAASHFLYPFHYSLNLKFLGLGYLIVGFCGTAMMLLCVSGVIIHRKIFVDFFTFRPERKIRRATLDLHNIAGVLGLPFHFVISLSGLAILYTLYFPSAIWAVYPKDAPQFQRDAYGSFARPPSGTPDEAISFDRIVDSAKASWGQGEPNYLYVFHPGDHNGYVEVNRSSDDAVSNITAAAYIDAVTGQALAASKPAKPAAATQRFIAGMHFIQFQHWTLRWLYFGLGLLGCVLVATGLLFWLETRRERHRRAGLVGARLVEAVAVGSICGIIVATLAFLVCNRLLPLNASALGIGRETLEVLAFYAAWVASLLHGWLRTNRAWAAQCWTICGLGILAALLNALTTGDHLFQSLAHPFLWPVAGVDMALLATAIVAACVALRLRRNDMTSAISKRMARAN